MTVVRENPWLGNPTEGVYCGIRNNGCFQHYENGSVYWSDVSKGAHAVPKTVMQKWAESKWETGSLGYPVSTPARTRPSRSGTPYSSRRERSRSVPRGKQACLRPEPWRGRRESRSGTHGWETRPRRVLRDPKQRMLPALRERVRVLVGRLQGSTRGPEGRHAEVAESKWETGSLGYPVSDPSEYPTLSKWYAVQFEGERSRSVPRGGQACLRPEPWTRR